MSTTTDSLRFFQPKLRLLEVVTWDVPTITEEIARLQNSLQHLEATQKILKEQVDLEPDEIEWKVAFDENVETMSSQNQRIELLKEALREKGILYDKHYDLDTNTSSRSPSDVANTTTSAIPPQAGQAGQDGGIDL